MAPSKKGYACPRCGGPMPTRRVRCAKCAEWDVRFGEGWRRFTTAAGAIEARLPYVSWRHRELFHKPDGLSPRSKVGAFLEILLGVAVNGAEYLPEPHQPWLVSLLHDMLTAKIDVRPSGWSRDEGPFTEMPLQAIHLGLEQWFDDITEGRNPRDLLLPHFALAAARFVEDHYWGTYGPVPLEGIAPRKFGQDRIYDGKGDKKDFTQRWCPVRVRAVVPRGAKLIVHRGYSRQGKPELEVLEEGKQFEFVIRRCFDSAGISDEQDLEAVVPKRAHDILCRFHAYGVLFEDPEPMRYLGGEIPFEWITEQRVRTEPTNPEKPWEAPFEWVPLPSWLKPLPERAQLKGVVLAHFVDGGGI